jgi:hypothetical protein
LSSGQLLRVLPRTYLTRSGLTDPDVILRAAVRYAGVPVAASHLTALKLWQLPVPDQVGVHLMTGETRHLRAAPGVLVHRRVGFVPEAPAVLIRRGIPTTRLETSIVDSWPLLDHDAKRAPALLAVAQRMTTPQRLRSALDEAPRLAGRRQLVQLIDKLAAGCHSELEIWGYDHVFHTDAMPAFAWQHPVVLDGRTVYLDVFEPRTRVNFELDGSKYHASLVDRERDLRRDAKLAAMGIMVVRFTHHRLVHQYDQVRKEVLAIVASRVR